MVETANQMHLKRIAMKSMNKRVVKIEAG